MMNIKEDDITFVVQGAPYVRDGVNYTVKSIASIRKYYPKASVVLSINQRGFLEAGQDVLINNEDVGAIKVEGMKPLNVNRQIVSSKGGILASRTKWICKIRTDMYFTKRICFQSLYQTHSKRLSDTTFEQRLIVSDITTKNFGMKEEFINHVSDWFYFGLRSDMIKLFDIPLYNLKNVPLKDKRYSISAETYIWTRGLKPSSPKGLEEADSYLVNNARIISAKKEGLACYKSGYNFPFGINGFAQYNDVDWLLMYAKFIDSKAKIKKSKIVKSGLLKFLFKLRWKLIYSPALFLKSRIKR